MFHKEFGINRVRKTREKPATKLYESAYTNAPYVFGNMF